MWYGTNLEHLKSTGFALHSTSDKKKPGNSTTVLNSVGMKLRPTHGQTGKGQSHFPQEDEPELGQIIERGTIRKASPCREGSNSSEVLCEQSTPFIRHIIVEAI